MKSIAVFITTAPLTVGPLLAQSAAPALPQGSLTVNTELIRAGVPPKIDWAITHPQEVTDVVEIDEQSVVTPTTRVRVKITMIGVGISDQRGNLYPATTYTKFGSSWRHVFTGDGAEVRPNTVLVDQIVAAGTEIKFAARWQNPNSGTTSQWFYNDSVNVEVFKNGDTPPTYAAGYSHQTSAQDYMRPYMENGKIKLGPRDLIYTAELTHTDRNHFGFDMQDAVMLVNFEEVDD